MNLREETVRPQIVLFGDSITEQSFFPNGWGAALTHTFSRKADVLVRGYGGYNTRWALFLLNRLFPLKCASAPSATIISFGANDASLLESSSERRQHVSLDEYKDNLIKIITHLKEANPSMAIVLVTPTPINESSKEQNSRTNETTGKYARKCVQLAHEMNLPCIDLWSIVQQTASWQTLFFSDGSELTKEGNEVVHKEAVRALRGAGLCVENMQLDFPHFSEIDVIYPQRAFCPDFQVEPCSFNQDDEMPSSSFTQDDTIYQEPVQNDLDCYDEEFLVEMVDPYGNVEESNVGPTYEEPFLLPLPDNAFFPGPSPADFLYEGNSTGPTFETNVVDRSFESVQFNVKREPISFVSSNSTPISTPEQIKELPAQVSPSSSQEEPAQAGPTLINPSQETLNPKTPKKNRSLEKKKSSSKRKIPPKKAKKRGSKKTCLHCEATKTPQWRIGPSGPGTLCNACGILYKKRGKLYDEYRPAGSPSFIASVHSNFQKEVVRKAVPAPAQPHRQPRLEPRAPMW